jgi:hypothetical protein
LSFWVGKRKVDLEKLAFIMREKDQYGNDQVYKNDFQIVKILGTFLDKLSLFLFQF